MNDYHDKPCFNLVAESIMSCFRFPGTIENLKEHKKRNIEFANSTLLKMWCDCSDNFEYNKLKYLIINYNTMSYEELEKFKKNIERAFIGNR